jgi:hypothetical protein
MTTAQMSAGVRAAADLLSTDEVVRRLTDVNGRPARSTTARQGAPVEAMLVVTGIRR